MLKKVLLCLLAALALTPAAAQEGGISACPLPKRAQATSWARAPESLYWSVIRVEGDILPPGAPLEAANPRNPATGYDRRVMFVWRFGLRWVVATEHTRYGYYNYVLAFDLSPDLQHAALAERRDATPSTLCAAAAGLLEIPSPRGPPVPACSALLPGAPSPPGGVRPQQGFCQSSDG
jgi:hypothetical protein